MGGFGAALTDYWCSQRTATGWPVEILKRACWRCGGAERLTYKCSLVAANQKASELEEAEGKQMNGWKFDDKWEIKGFHYD